MTLNEMRDEAIRLVTLYTEADCKPDICAEIPELVARHQRASIWTAATVYGVGDVVQLYPRNGARYVCVQAGTSAASSAAFPITALNTWGSHYLTDGTVRWHEAGRDYKNVFDVRAAAHAGCLLKAVRSSHLVTTSAGNARIEAGALQSQWRARAADYAPMGVA